MDKTNAALAGLPKSTCSLDDLHEVTDALPYQVIPIALKDEVLLSEHLSLSAKSVWQYLYNHSDFHTRKVSYNRAKIAREFNCAEKTIKRAIDQLKRNAWIKVLTKDSGAIYEIQVLMPSSVYKKIKLGKHRRTGPNDYEKRDRQYYRNAQGAVIFSTYLNPNGTQTIVISEDLCLDETAQILFEQLTTAQTQVPIQADNNNLSNNTENTKIKATTTSLKAIQVESSQKTEQQDLHLGTSNISDKTSEQDITAKMTTITNTQRACSTTEVITIVSPNRGSETNNSSVNVIKNMEHSCQSPKKEIPINTNNVQSQQDFLKEKLKENIQKTEEEMFSSSLSLAEKKTLIEQHFQLCKALKALKTRTFVSSQQDTNVPLTSNKYGTKKLTINATETSCNPYRSRSADTQKTNNPVIHYQNSKPADVPLAYIEKINDAIQTYKHIISDPEGLKEEIIWAIARQFVGKPHDRPNVRFNDIMRFNTDVAIKLIREKRWTTPAGFKSNNKPEIEKVGDHPHCTRVCVDASAADVQCAEIASVVNMLERMGI